MEASLGQETAELLEHHIHLLWALTAVQRAGFFPSPWASPLSDLEVLVFSQLSHVRRARDGDLGGKVEEYVKEQ